MLIQDNYEVVLLLNEIRLRLDDREVVVRLHLHKRGLIISGSLLQNLLKSLRHLFNFKSM